MAVISGFPILSTSDLEGLVDFYCAAFEAVRTYGFAGDDGRDVYVALAIGEMHLGIGEEAGARDGDRRTALWFYVDDIEDAYRRTLDAGATGESPPTDMPWGERVARILDPDGGVIHLGAAS